MDDYEFNKNIYINNIKELMTKSINTSGIINRVNIMIEMFEYFLTIPQFLAKEAKFRKATLLKIDEIYEEIKVLHPENGNKLCDLLNNVKIFVDNLKFRNDYLSINDYDPFVHKIIITL